MAQTTTQTPPILFTKQLTSFLGSYLSPSTHTLLLTTPAGKLLAHAADGSPASALRGRATVAAGLVRMYSSSSARRRHRHHTRRPDDNDSTEEEEDEDEEEEEEVRGAGGAGERRAPTCVTVQMTDGVFVVRRLNCGLLLVCVGPEEPRPDEADSVVSGGGAGTSVRRVAEEVARVLEGRFAGLRVPGDVVGSE
ncbi:uncharacterized protein DNG_07711 [Cephalotrichum gorgonifer]|uniref:Uncharacterized protein n=1 Tax=Cephalotrichum gorgonifer TaxID=2041049 RepID=A0AAE8SXN7_9PEZI|nr:uncharacterized protein DNG_07711 [Cephalotrichum gorgonifer]